MYAVLPKTCLGCKGVVVSLGDVNVLQTSLYADYDTKTQKLRWFQIFPPGERLSIASISIAVFSSDACKESELEICPEMHSIAKLTNIPKYLLSNDENNNYSITKITHEASQDALPLLRKFVLIIVIILSVKNMREGLLFGFKGLTWAKGDFLILFLFSLVFFLVVSSPLLRCYN